MASRALRAIPEKEEVKSEIEEEKEREAEARPEDDETEEVRRKVLESLRTLLATQATPPDDNDVLTRAVDVTGSTATAAIPFYNLLEISSTCNKYYRCVP